MRAVVYKKPFEVAVEDVPKPEFVNLEAGFELFTRTGTALPEETVEGVIIAA